MAHPKNRNVSLVTDPKGFSSAIHLKRLQHFAFSSSPLVLLVLLALVTFAFTIQVARLTDFCTVVIVFTACYSQNLATSPSLNPPSSDEPTFLWSADLRVQTGQQTGCHFSYIPPNSTSFPLTKFSVCPCEEIYAPEYLEQSLKCSVNFIGGSTRSVRARGHLF